MEQPVIEQLVVDASRALLKTADEFAVKNFPSGNGGPFGAIAAVLDFNSGSYKTIGNISANAVLKTGSASAHAEDQWLQPDNLKSLVRELKKDWWNPRTVILASSGQSCPACHAKEEVVARYLVRYGVIQRLNFVVAYGATFKNTQEIAGFNDQPYVLDLVRCVRYPQSSVSMVKHKTASIKEIPSNIVLAFKNAGRQVCVVARGDNIVSVGYDDRSYCNFFSTAESMAIRNACTRQKAEGSLQPWVVGDVNHLAPDPQKKATLYTTTQDVGPIMRGEAQWAAVNEIVSVTGLRGAKQTQEAPDISNRALLGSVAQGYNHAQSVMRVCVDEGFANQAQHEWRKKLKKYGSAMLYNGIDSDPNLESFAVFAGSFKGLPLAL